MEVTKNEQKKASVQRIQHEILKYHYAGKRPGVAEGEILMKEFTRSDCYLAGHPLPCET